MTNSTNNRRGMPGYESGQTSADLNLKAVPTFSIVVCDRDGSERSAAFYSEARRDRFAARIEAEGGRVIHKGTQN